MRTYTLENHMENKLENEMETSVRFCSVPTNVRFAGSLMSTALMEAGLPRSIPEVLSRHVTT